VRYVRAMPSDRVLQLRQALDVLVAGESGDAAIPDGDDPWALALRAFAASWWLNHVEARDYADRAIGALPNPHSADPQATVLAYATRVLAGAGTGLKGTWSEVGVGLSPTGDLLIDSIPHLVEIDDPSDGSDFARHVLAEAALACGRVAVADQIDDAGGAGELLAGHPYGTVMTVLAARIASFGGRIDDARVLLDGLPETGTPRLEQLVLATRSLVDGNAAAPMAVRDLAARIESEGRVLADRLELGCVMLCAYGLVAIGDVTRAAALVGTFDMSRAMVIDKVLALELVVAAAERTGDRWTAEAALVAAEEHADDPIAKSTLDRMRGRVALLAGAPDDALVVAERAIDRADGEGRAIEAAEGRIVAARARVASGRGGAAARGLELPVAAADASGHRAFRRAAGRTLRGTGRRLRPLPGSEAAGLSEREREVLTLMLEGKENSDIAMELHISPHTARSHVSRVLAAYGTTTRSTLAARVAASMQDTNTAARAGVALGELTPRQSAVVEHVLTGASNADIASGLGISVRTVEKHVNDAMHRWRVGSRVALILRGAGIEVDACPEK